MEDKPETYTMVLIPGAWSVGAAFTRLKKQLEKMNHTVHTPTVAGHGFDVDKSVSYEAQVQSVLDYIDARNLEEKPVVVGHSYGGLIAAGVAAQMPDEVRRVVLWNAFVLSGECVLDVVPPGMREAFTQLHEEEPDGSVMLPFGAWRERFMNNATMKEAKASYEMLSPEPWRSVSDPIDCSRFIQLAAEGRLDCSYLNGTADVALPPGEEFGWLRFANRLGGMERIVEFPGGNHAAYVNRSKKAAKYLVMAAQD